MADNYLERKFDEYYSTPTPQKRKVGHIQSRRNIAIVGLSNDIFANSIEHSLRMLGHKTCILNYDNFQDNTTLFDTIITTSKNAEPLALHFINHHSDSSKHGYRFIVIDNKPNTEAIVQLFQSTDIAINFIHISATTKAENLALTCRIFLADEYSFLNKNTLYI